ncbi:MAG: Ig-like domain-containing protein, partial [Anaerolineaceae bacterium]
MRKSVLIRSLILVLTLAMILIACRRDEDATPTAVSSSQPTETPAAEADTAPPTATKETAPAATKEPPPTATPEKIAAVAPEDIDWPPQVVVSDPAPGEEMAVDSEIALRFDQPMDPDSVEAAWDIDPAVDGGFQWPQPDTLVFSPSEELKRNQQYRVLVDESALSSNGIALQEEVQLNLQTIGDLQVSQVIPPDNTRDVQAGGAITVVFTRPVVPLVSSDEQANLPQPLTIEPAVDGQGSWVSTSIYRFVPGEEGFAGATAYRVTIDEGLTDVTGAILPADFTSQFTTESPDVIMIQPPNGATLVPPTRPISITFNMSMDPASTEAAVSLQPASPVSYEWQDNNRHLILTPQDMLELETDYDLVVSQSARSANGQASLNNEHISRFTTIPFPAVTGTSPANGATADSWQRGVSIQFASPMDMSTLEDRILIEPAPEEVKYYYNEWIDEFNPGNSSFDLSLTFDLEHNTDYVVTIPGDAADPFGNTLGQDYTWQFSVPGYAPVASFNLPQPLGQLSTSFPTDVEIVHRNVSQLNVALYDMGLPLDLLGYTYLNDEIPFPEPARTWSLPTNTPPEEIGLTTVSLADGAVLSPGVYFLTVSSPEIGGDSRYWQNQRQMLVVAGTNVVAKEMPDEVHVWTTDLES